MTTYLNQDHPSPGLIYFLSANKQRNNNNRTESLPNASTLPNPSNTSPINPYSCLKELKSLDKNVDSLNSFDLQFQSSSVDPLSPPSRHIVRHQPCFEDEQLSWKGSTLIWSKGTTIYKKFDYSHPQNRPSHFNLSHQSNSSTKHIQQALFALFDPPDSKPLSNPEDPLLNGPLDAHFSFEEELSFQSTSEAQNHNRDISNQNHNFSCPDSPHHFEPWSDNRSSQRSRCDSSNSTVRGLCVLLSDILKVYLETGEEYSLAIPFPIQRMWPIERGLMIMRKPTSVRPRPFIPRNVRHPIHSPLLQTSSSKLKNQSRRTVNSLMFDSLVTENEATRLWSSLAGFELDDRRAADEDHLKADDGDLSAEMARYWAERKQLESSMLWTLSDPSIAPLTPLITPPRSLGSALSTGTVVFVSDPVFDPFFPICVTASTEGFTIFLYGRLPPNTSQASSGIISASQAPLPSNSPHASFATRSPSPPPPPPQPSSAQMPQLRRSPRKLTSSSNNNKNFEQAKNESSTLSPTYSRQPIGRLGGLGHPSIRRNSISINKKRGANSTANLSSHASNNRRLSAVSNSSNSSFTFGPSNHLMKSTHNNSNNQRSIVEHQLDMMSNGLNQSQNSRAGKLGMSNHREIKNNGFDEWFDGITEISNNLASMIGVNYKKNDDDDDAHLADEALEPEFVIQTLETVEIFGRLTPEELPLIHAAIYDSRGSSAHLGICVPSKSKVYIFQMIRSSSSIFLKSLGKPLEGTSIGPVLCSRPNVYDLFKFSNLTGQIEIFSAESILVHKFLHPDPNKSDQRNIWVNDLLCNLIFEVVSEEAGNQQLIQIFQKFIKVPHQKSLKDFDQNLEIVLREAVIGESLTNSAEKFNSNNTNAFKEVDDYDDDGDSKIFEEIFKEIGADPIISRLRTIQELKAMRKGHQSVDEPVKMIGQTPGSPRKRNMRQASTSRKDQLLVELRRKKLMIGLGKLFADLRCSNLTTDEYFRLGKILIGLCESLGWIDWVDQLRRSIALTSPEGASSNRFGTVPYLKIEEPLMPNLNDHLDRICSNFESPHNLYFDEWVDCKIGFFGSSFHPAHQKSKQVSKLFKIISSTRDPNGLKTDILKQIDRFAWDEDDLNDLNLIDLLIIIRESLKSCRESIDRIDQGDDDQLSIRFYELIGRNDLSSILIDKYMQTSNIKFKESGSLNIKPKKTFHVTNLLPPSILQLSSAPISIENQNLIPSTDDLESNTTLKESPTGISVAARFSDDMRIIDVAKMLNYCQEIRLQIKESLAEMPAIEIARQHSSFFTGISKRTMALPLGGACFWYKTDPNIAANVPMIKLDVRLLPTNVIIQPDPVKIEPLSWPRFHAGVAAALSLSVDPRDFDSSQISLGRPDELDDRHAGYLLGLGLNQHLKSINRVQIFRYLESKHDMTSIGVLLGLSSAFIGTGDPRVSSIIAAHVPAMHPTESIQLQVNPLIQSAGFMGFGILHLGTGNRRISDGMLRELGKTWRVLTDTPDDCRESYTLCAGLGYGLVMLGKGTESDTPAHKDLMRTFKGLIHGDGAHPLPGLNQPTTTIDVSVTSPAATLALALLFLKTGKSEAAELCEIPQTQIRLEYVRPDLLMIRTLAKNLIMWNQIGTEPDWVERFVPKFIMEKVKRLEAAGSVKKLKREIEMIYWSVISGSSLALAFRYAGSASGAVHSILLKLYDKLLKVVLRPVLSVQDKVRRHCLRSCHNVITLGLAMVMAGTGELEVLRRLRVAHSNVQDSVGYGTHLVTHLALGLLFLGGGRYTLGSSNRAIGCLVCAMYPIFPSRTDDQVYHLQALRHLWALAVEPRCLIARDVDRKDELIFLPIKLKIQEESDQANNHQDRSRSLLKTKLLTAPTLIPELQTIRAIRVESPRYWPLTIDLNQGLIQGDHLKKNLTIWVKRKVGQLSYSQDPKGTRSIFSRGRTAEEITGCQIDDFGERLNSVKGSMKRNFFLELENEEERFKKFDGENGDHIERLIEGFDLDEQSTGLVNYLCNNCDQKNSQKLKGEGIDLSSFTSISLLQCLFEDKLEIFSIYLKLYLKFSLNFRKLDNKKANRARQKFEKFFKESVDGVDDYDMSENDGIRKSSRDEESEQDVDTQERGLKAIKRQANQRARTGSSRRRFLVDLNLLKQIDLNQRRRIDSDLWVEGDTRGGKGGGGELKKIIKRYIESDGKTWP
ncbi:hypothetical protein PPACK8108_LOCUS20963, partial [Phakopsora pachyrhizi]